jgi:ubiquinone/menaquinone biosynthesis C-methylase UbiE
MNGRLSITQDIASRGLDAARLISSSWRSSSYYAQAEEEGQIDFFWRPGSPFMRGLAAMDLSDTLELSAGHGRHALRLLATPACSDRLRTLIVMDVNDNLIARCKERISDARASFLVTDGASFRGVPDHSLSAIYCFDSMVHFEVVTVMAYLADCARVLKPGGMALFHHSNFDRSPGAVWHAAPHARNFMSVRLFQHLAMREGLEVCWSSVIDWAEMRDLDAITLLRYAG